MVKSSIAPRNTGPKGLSNGITAEVGTNLHSVRFAAGQVVIDLCRFREFLMNFFSRLTPALFVCSVISIAAAQTQNDPGEPGVITGNVIDSVGDSVADARVYVREHNMPQTGAVRYVTTDQTGQFRIRDLRPGDYDLYAVPPHSASMLSRSVQRVHLPKDRPVGRVTVRIGNSAKHESS